MERQGDTGIGEARQKNLKRESNGKRSSSVFLVDITLLISFPNK